jgi:hypothetical protein
MRADQRNTRYKRNTAGGEFTSAQCALEFRLAQDVEQEVQGGSKIIRTYRWYTKRPNGPSVGLMTEVRTPNVSQLCNLTLNLIIQIFDDPETSETTSVFNQEGPPTVIDDDRFNQWMQEANASGRPQSVSSGGESTKRRRLPAVEPISSLLPPSSTRDQPSPGERFYGQQPRSKRPALSGQPYGIQPSQGQQYLGKEGWQVQPSYVGGGIQNQPSYGGPPSQGYLSYEEHPPPVAPTAFMLPSLNTPRNALVSLRDRTLD